MQRFFGLGGGTGGATSTSPKNRSDSGTEKDNKKKPKATDLIEDAFNAEEFLDD
jgi:hypothetical protein